MKMFVLVYASMIDDYVIAAITKGGINAYTKWIGVHGTGPETGPKLRYKQGDNHVLTIVVSNEDADKVRDVVLKLRKEYSFGGVRCFVVPVEEMI
jgi:nitrogen regulatory protein PII